MPERILIVDDEDVICNTLSDVLREEGYSVSTAKDGDSALKQIGQASFDLVFCDVVMPGINGIELLKTMRNLSSGTAVVIMSAFGTVKNAVEAMKEGAIDYIVKPFVFDEVILRVKRIFDERRLIRSNMALREDVKKQQRYDAMVGTSPQIQTIFTLIGKVAPTDSNVLITGKSGTGKELVARIIHKKSMRAEGVFLPINCAAIPAELFESEFFGFRKGGFTGATHDREGYFKIADGGTIFLDEICSIPLHQQAKLLRVIETREIIPVGGKDIEDIDVRIVASSNKDLQEEVSNNRFRDDLYYRLKVFEIALLPLRERREDIPLLVDHFIKKYNTRLKKNVKSLENPVMNRFLNYEWKGNIRELENVIERAMILCEGDIITEKDVFMDSSYNCHLSHCNSALFNLKESAALFEKEHIRNVLKRTENDKKKAADLMGLSLSSLYRKIEELKIEEISRK